MKTSSRSFCFVAPAAMDHLGSDPVVGTRLPHPPRTGWPPGMLQDDSCELSLWLANTPEARRCVREVCAEIVGTRTAHG